ncbi:uncharacterized protein LOC129266459 [Lytechinus pictus]|uniref:uncharacterized protein LOC129266459 n=1 Tax=Lytechinus pictus TaxID=7653 RepID=UPI0030BA1354
MWGQQAQTCRGRCDLYVNFAPCQCDNQCIVNENCCSDFWSTCLEIRLVNGNSPNEGRVELVLGSTSIGSICDEGWSIMDATVACNQLGYPGASLRTMGEVFGTGNLPLIASKFLCNGDEAKITDCSFVETRGFCPSGGGAGIICQKPGYQGCFGRSSNSLLLRDNHLFDNRMTGDLCIQHCSRGKYELAAVRGRDCTCGLGIPIDSDYYHDFRCRMPCPGDSRQVCGGYTEGRLMVYKTNTGFCRHPGDPANGQRLDSYFRFGARVTFRCNPGYKLGGNTTIQCIPRGHTQRPIKNLAWDGIAPVCIGNGTSIQMPGPSKGKGSVRNIIIGLVVSFLIILILLILFTIWRMRRKMNQKAPPPPPPPVPMSASKDSPFGSDHAVQAKPGVRPVYASMAPRSERESCTNNAVHAAGGGKVKTDGRNENFNKCMPNGYSNSGYGYCSANKDDHVMSPVINPRPAGVPGKVFYSTKIKKKIDYQTD